MTPRHHWPTGVNRGHLEKTYAYADTNSMESHNPTLRSEHRRTTYRTGNCWRMDMSLGASLHRRIGAGSDHRPRSAGQTHGHAKAWKSLCSKGVRQLEHLQPVCRHLPTLIKVQVDRPERYGSGICPSRSLTPVILVMLAGASSRRRSLSTRMWGGREINGATGAPIWSDLDFADLKSPYYPPRGRS
jgi:hypothetical protein